MWVRIPVDRSSVKRQATGRRPGSRRAGSAAARSSRCSKIVNCWPPRCKPSPIRPFLRSKGYRLPLLAATGQSTPQTFTVTSSNPDIAASIIGGNTVLDSGHLLHRPAGEQLHWESDLPVVP